MVEAVYGFLAECDSMNFVRIVTVGSALLVAGQTQAALPVIDTANLMQQYKSVLQSAQQLEQQVMAVAQLKAQLEQQIATVASLAHAPANELNSLRSQLSQITSLPNAANMQSMVSGTNGGGLSPMLNSLSQVGSGITGLQNLAGQLYQTSQDRMNALRNLEDSLASSPDAKSTADINGEIALQQAQLAAQQVQGAALHSMAAAQSSRMVADDAARWVCWQAVALKRNGTLGPLGADECANVTSQAPATWDSGALTADGSNPDGGGSGGGADGGGGTDIAPSANYAQYMGRVVGSGSCAVFAETATPGLGTTAGWRPGQSVQGASLAVGTPIATFQGQNYTNSMNGNSHTALYMGQNAQGIQVMDAWVGQPAHMRTINWNGNTPANSGTAFRVITHASA